MRSIAWPGLTAALLVLGACATMPKGIALPDLGSWDTRVEVLSRLEEWTFKGRIAVKAGDDGFNGKINWAQQGDAFNTTVGGPLGVGTVRIEGDGRGIVLTDKDGEETALVDAEFDLQMRYGWTIPVASLRYWALGIPDPGRPATTDFDDEGRLVRLQQNTWTVEIQRYQEGGGQPMPRILTATSPDTRVRMVIDHWVFFGR